MIVQPDGPRDARIAFVGARPGRDEVQAGRPYAGWAGNLLFKLLGADRSSCYLTNVRRDHDPNRSIPTQQEIAEALPALKAELEQVRANVIVPLGGAALQALTGETSIEKWRGSILESTLLPGRKVIPTWEPAHCARDWPQTYVLEHDLRRVKRESNTPNINRPKRDFLLNPTLEQAVGFLDSLDALISVDIESAGSIITCVGIADRPDRAICIPFNRGRLTRSELAYLFRRLDNVFRTRRCVGQNFQFDVTKLERLGFRFPQIEGDTMLAHHLLWPEFDHDLGFITSIYTEEPYYKHEIRSDDLETFWSYNCKDAACTLEAWFGLEEELKHFGQLEYFREHVLSLLRPIMAMQARGFRVDFSRLHEIRRRLELETQLLQLRLNKAVDFNCNVRSTTDLRYLLQEKLALPTVKYTKTGAVSTDEETLRKLSYNSPHADLFKLILDIRERRTLVSGFLNLEVDENGRYSANYLIHGTDSGRFSSRAARKGPQLQNVPPRARVVFISDADKELLQSDLRRAEAMYVAYAACEESLIELFNDPLRDFYNEIAASSLGIPIEHVQKWQRDVFKRVVHASNYGMGPVKFITVLRMFGIAIEDIEIRGIYGNKAKSEYLIESYHHRFPGIRRWQARIRDEVRRTRTLRSAFGRRRPFLGRMDDSLYRAAFSYPPQATIVGITNLAIRRLCANGIVPLTQQHDGIIIEYPAGRFEEGGRILADAMTVPLQVEGRTMIIPVELKRGKSWGEMTEFALAS